MMSLTSDVTARSPSPMKAVNTVQSMEWDPCADTESPIGILDTDKSTLSK